MIFFYIQRVTALHELTIIETLIAQVEKEVLQSGQRGRVVGLSLVIGRLSGVNVDSIRFAFGLLSPDTSLAGAELCIEEPRASIRCEDCETETEIEELVANCPACGSQHVTIVGGQDLLLNSIEVEEE